MAATLSIVMANYNHGRYIQRAIRAVQSQNVPPDEYIVIDDASTDNSWEIIQRYADAVSYMQAFRHETNQGIFSTFKELLDMTSGAYVQFVSADDFLDPGYIQSVKAMMVQYPQAGIIFGNMQYRYPDGKKIRLSRPKRFSQTVFLSPKDFFERYVCAEKVSFSLSGATTYKKECLEAVGGWHRELHSTGDTFALQAVGLTFGACYNPDIVTNISYLPGSYSAKISRNPKILLDMIGRSVYLMKSERYRGLFPEKFVFKWRMSYLMFVLLLFVYYTLTEKSESANWAARFFYKAVNCLMLPVRLISLLCYKPDLSCYPKPRG